MFFEGSTPNSIKIEGNQYVDRGESLGGNNLGHSYHIFLCKGHPTEDRYEQFDNFEAILADPLEYISGLIPDGWCGIIARKTTTSETFMNRTLDIFKKHL